MPRRKRQDKRRRDELTLREEMYASLGPRITRADGNDGRAEFKAWDAEHGRAWRFQHGCPTNSDWLAAFERTGEGTMHIPTAQAEVRRLLEHRGVVEEFDLQVDHPDPPRAPWGGRVTWGSFLAQGAQT